MIYKKLISIIVLFVLFLYNTSIMAQCAMCRVSASSDLEGGGSFAQGLNTGIFYLMAIPYIILMLGGYFFFREPIDARIREWKTKHFGSK